MAYSDDIKDFALDLFLQYTDEGGHKYSSADISAEILQKFDKVIDRSTIQTWSKASGWDVLFQSGLNQGVEQAINEAKEKDETIREAKAREGKQLYQQNKSKNDLTGYLVIETLKYYAIRLKNGEITVEQIPFNIRDLELVNRMSFENMLKLDGDKQVDKIDELFDRLDAMV